MSSVEVVNLGLLQGKFDALKAELRGQVGQQAALAGARVFEEGVRSKIVGQGLVDTGALLGSVQVSTGRRGTGTVKVQAKHARFLEYGTGMYSVSAGRRKTAWTYYNKSLGRFVKTRGGRPHPFLRPAFIEKYDAAAEAAKDVVTDAVRGAL